MKVRDVQDYLCSLRGDWVNPEKSVDRFIYGDPDRELAGIAVGWMSYGWALQRAAALGCNLFITHEPTFYNHWDNEASRIDSEAARRKVSLLEETGLAVLRCHDLWDGYPGLGIPDRWAAFLALGPSIRSEGFYRVIDVSGHTVGSLARHVAGRVRELGQDAVEVIGDLDAPVSTLAIGTGANTPLRRFMAELQVDAAICTDDGFVYWRDGAMAIDTGFPVIVVHHHVAEEYGFRSLADHLRERFSPVDVHFIPQTCMYRLVG